MHGPLPGLGARSLVWCLTMLWSGLWHVLLEECIQWTLRLVESLSRLSPVLQQRPSHRRKQSRVTSYFSTMPLPQVQAVPSLLPSARPDPSCTLPTTHSCLRPACAFIASRRLGPHQPRHPVGGQRRVAAGPRPQRPEGMYLRNRPPDVVGARELPEHPPCPCGCCLQPLATWPGSEAAGPEVGLPEAKDVQSAHNFATIQFICSTCMGPSTTQNRASEFSRIRSTIRSPKLEKLSSTCAKYPL